MTAVLPADNTVAAIVTKVRRLTASASEASLKTDDIYQYINTYYNNDFPYSIKIDQQRNVYTFFTQPYIDRYPLDVNYNQGVRAPMYVEGIQGTFYKDRQQFFNVWPRYPTLLQQGGSSTSGSITAITQPSSPNGQITIPNHNLVTGAVIFISGMLGYTSLNNAYYTITVVDANNVTLNGVSIASSPAYTGGGTWTSTSQKFSFMVQAPFLSKEVVIGGTDQNGNAITINDDGNGNLQLQVPNPVTSTPAFPYTYTGNPLAPIPGEYNKNLGNPGLNYVGTLSPPYSMGIGTVNYITGQINFTLPYGISLANGTQLTVWVSLYQTGRPYALLFWNNEFTIRPIPKLVHKIEVETYLTPVQFMLTTDSPILNQWWQLIAIGAAIKVLEDRQDMEGVENLKELYNRQQDLTLERQGVEELFQPNINLFNSTQTSFGYGGGLGGAAF
jgi:hypothetical protein